jgi:hypothetical protein
MAGPAFIAGPTMGTPATIAILMAVPRIGTTVPGMLTALGAARQAGTTGQAAPQDGAEVPHRGTMDRATSAAIAVAPLHGEGGQAARLDGGAAPPAGAAGRVPSMGPTADRVAGGADVAGPE